LKNLNNFKSELEETKEKDFQNSIQTQIKINKKIDSIKKAHEERCKEIMLDKQQKEAQWYQNRR